MTYFYAAMSEGGAEVVRRTAAAVGAPLNTGASWVMRDLVDLEVVGLLIMRAIVKCR